MHCILLYMFVICRICLKNAWYLQVGASVTAHGPRLLTRTTGACNQPSAHFDLIEIIVFILIKGQGVNINLECAH